MSVPAAGARCAGGQGWGRGRRRGSSGTHAWAPRGPRERALSLRRATSVSVPSAVWVAWRVRVMRAVWACCGHQRTPSREGEHPLFALLGLGPRPAPGTVTHGKCAERAGRGELWCAAFVMVDLCFLLLVWGRLGPARAALACRCCGARGAACIPCYCCEMSHPAMRTPWLEWSVARVARGADHE
jgi:hypothetical protein